jgi:hypothetical protein
MAPVIDGSQPAHKPRFNKPVDQLDRAVVLQLHPFGQHPNGRFQPFGQTAKRKQQLMLLRLDACSPRGIFTKAEKATNLIAEFRHRLKLTWRQARTHILLRYYRKTICFAKANAHFFLTKKHNRSGCIPVLLQLPLAGSYSDLKEKGLLCRDRQPGRPGAVVLRDAFARENLTEAVGLLLSKSDNEIRLS